MLFSNMEICSILQTMILHSSTSFQTCKWTYHLLPSPPMIVRPLPGRQCQGDPSMLPSGDLQNPISTGRMPVPHLWSWHSCWVCLKFTIPVTFDGLIESVGQWWLCVGLLMGPQWWEIKALIKWLWWHRNILAYHDFKIFIKATTSH